MATGDKFVKLSDLKAAFETKVDKVIGKGLSANDYTTEEKEKLANIDPGISSNILKAFPIETVSGSIASFSDGADGMPIQSLAINMDPIQEGSGDPAPDNVRPISGRTGATVKQMGKNLLPPTTYLSPGGSLKQNGVTMTRDLDGSLSFSGTTTAVSWFYINRYSADHSADFEFPAGNYILSSNITGETSATGYRFLMSIYNLSGTLIRQYVDLGQGVNVTINGNEIEAVYLYVPSGKVMDGITIYPMLRLTSDTGSTFEPYQSNTYSITFPTEAGTVYGGTLDVISGKLTVDWILYDASEFTQQAHNNGFICYRRQNCAPAADPLDFACSMFGENATTIDSSNLTDERLRINVDTNIIYFSLLDTRDKSDFVVAYKIASPVVYQLTQLTPLEVKSLLGTNNIWSDGGDADVTYHADIRLYIDKKIAEAISTLTNT